MPTGTGTSCYTKEYLSTNGSLVENQDGSVSVFVKNTQNILAPVFLTSYCCEFLGYTFDAVNQKCLWSKNLECSIENSFNIELNPVGNSGVIFNVGANESCQLSVEFDYLFKIKCETLNDFLLASQNSPAPTYDPAVLTQIIQLQGDIQDQETACSTIQNTINFLTAATQNTPYSISCSQPTLQPSVALPNSSIQIMGSTAFGSLTKTPLGSIGTQQTPQLTPQQSQNVANQTFCILEPDGLAAWATILGPVNYENFINGDPTSYGCDEVYQMYQQSQTAVATGGQPLILPCITAFGTRTTLEVSLANSLQEQIDCNNTLQTLYSELATLTATQETQVVKCGDPIDMFETLDVSMTLSVYSGGTYVVIYEDNTLFPAIGAGNLYNYLTVNSPSGFYVCGGSDCQPMYLNNGQFIGQNTTTCDAVADNLAQALFVESGLQNTPADITTFTDSIPTDSFNSDWLSFNTYITDPVILSAITNQKIKINLKLNHTCGDICILMDNIKLNKDCSTISNRNIFVTECPGFKLEKVIDNKKSWLANTTPVNRDFRIFNANGLYPIRQTNYNVNNERLVINTKEIDLDINIAAAIETDVWCYIVDNPCLLTGQTLCDPCGDYKQFQDDLYYEFMDGNEYEFMDQNQVLNTGSLPSTCCGDDQIDFNALLTQPLSAVTVLEDFQYYALSELIDAKNRQTISAYPTLRALYDRYIQSTTYCAAQSSAFDYYTMDQFANLVGNYWVDIIEQVIPATTIWGSIKVYTNTIFDQQKFKYKAYTSLLCGNVFSGETVLSPINGTSGQCQTVEVITQNLSITGQTPIRIVKPQLSSCGTLCLAQMNHGSEFIGGVNIISVTPTSCTVQGTVIVDCSLGVTITTQGLTATANVVNGTAPIYYDWSNGATGQTTTFPSLGTYYLTVSDGNCCNITKEVVFT